MKKLFSLVLCIVMLISVVSLSYALKIVPVKSIKLDKSSLSMDVGKTFSLKVTFSPANTTQKKLIFSTSNNSVAKVDTKGKITAVKAGSAVITATSTSNKKIAAKCTVKVLAKAPVKLSVICLQQDGGGNKEDIWLWPYMEKKFNLKLDVTQIPIAALAEKKSIMLASNGLADLMISLNFTANEIVRYGQIEEQLLAYNDIVNAKKMPNLYKWIKDKPESVGWFTAPNGKIYTLPGYNGFAQEIGQIKRYFINQTWLSEAGLNTPETLDEFTAMLRAFKNKHPDSVPLGGSANIANSYTNSGDYILNALGFLLGSVSESQTLEGVPSLRNGNVVIPAYTNIYYEYLRIMRDYFKEGLISSDFFTLDLNTVRALMAEKKTGVTPEPAYLALPAETEFSKWFAVKPLTSKWNNKKQWVAASPVLIGGIASGAKANTPEKLDAIARFVDFYYSDIGFILTWNGPKLDSEDELGMVKGWYVKQDGTIGSPMVDKGLFSSLYNYNLGKITPFQNMFGIKSNPLGRPSMSSIEFMKELSGMKANTEITFNLANGDLNYRSSVYKNIYPYVVRGFPSIMYFNNDDSIKINELASVITPKIKTETAKFITGARPLSEFSAFQDELTDLGIEKYLSYYVEGYKSYKANLAK